ncbi:MAG: thermonuclease family protein [bacterium]|nr:thermonuclease family protein [bacterium]
MIGHLKCKLLLIALLMPAFVSTVPALGPQTTPLCKAKHQRTALVTKVFKDGILQLQSGELVRLMGVMPVKQFDQPTSSVAKKLNAIGVQAVELLQREVVGKRVELHQSGRVHDRYDRLLAHVYSHDGKWIQGLLLQAGLARSFSYRNNRICMPQMLALEKTARHQRIGLWRYQTFQPQPAARQKQLLRRRYRFSLVEGRVRKIAVVKRWMFLNFGNDWRSDFTIAIKKKYKRSIERDGLALEKLTGKRVRVRGWIELWNGPVIKVTHKEQIELLEEE